MPHDLFINGEWITAYGPTLTSINPATQEEVWKGCQASNSDVNRAVKAANDAFPYGQNHHFM